MQPRCRRSYRSWFPESFESFQSSVGSKWALGATRTEPPGPSPMFPPPTMTPMRWSRGGLFVEPIPFLSSSTWRDLDNTSTSDGVRDEASVLADSGYLILRQCSLREGVEGTAWSHKTAGVGVGVSVQQVPQVLSAYLPPRSMLPSRRGGERMVQGSHISPN